MTTKFNYCVLVSLFARVGAKAFGGQIPVHLWDSLVTGGWLTQKEYLEAFNWSQCIPGCNGTNLSAYLGYKSRGPWGAFGATLALLLPGTLMLLLVATLIAKIPPHHSALQAILSTVAAATVGLLLGMTCKIARSTLSHPLKLLIAVSAFVCAGLLRVPILIVIIVLGLFSWVLGQSEAETDHEHPV
jgi:chromate transporter